MKKKNKKKNSFLKKYKIFKKKKNKKIKKINIQKNKKKKFHI